MMNVKNFNTYSSKFVLSVVDLNKVELATEEDKAFRIDYWAKIFKAKTWEDLKMLVKDNEYLEEAANSLYVANADEIVRQQCRARADAERRERTLERDNRILREQNAALQVDNDALQADKDALRADNTSLKEEMEDAKKAEERFERLIQILYEEEKPEEVKKVLLDKKYREELLKMYQL